MKEFVKNKIRGYLREKFSLGYDKNDFEYTVRELVQMYESSADAVRWHGEILNGSIKKYKKSDTLFVLGSGPSINSISDEQWRAIKAHDSIGFNYWLAHDHVPDFFMFQLSGSNMIEAVRHEQEKYKNIPFIIRGSEFAKKGRKDLELDCGFLKNNPVYYLREYPISSKCTIKPDLLIKYMHALGYLDFGNVSGFVPKWRCTLGLLISLAYQMGYKNIVLCGVDMNGSDHFWDYAPYSSMEKNYTLPKIGVSNIMTFNDKGRSPNTVSLYVEKLRDWMLENSEVRISVLSTETSLYPTIELYRSDA